jgi:hypothetical protein
MPDMPIQVVNRHTYTGTGIYIGRPTALGNPFTLSPGQDRDTCIALYRTWLRDQWRQRRLAKTMLRQLARQYQQTGHLVLICSCAPRPCHGDVIREAILAICAQEAVKP